MLKLLLTALHDSTGVLVKAYEDLEKIYVSTLEAAVEKEIQPFLKEKENIDSFAAKERWSKIVEMSEKDREQKSEMLQQLRNVTGTDDT